MRVVIVAPSLTILGGQAVQADSLLRSWAGDPEVSVSLLPVNPIAPWPFRPLQRVKYLRTVLTQALYWPSLVAGLRRADIVHAFHTVAHDFGSNGCFLGDRQVTRAGAGNGVQASRIGSHTRAAACGRRGCRLAGQWRADLRRGGAEDHDHNGLPWR